MRSNDRLPRTADSLLDHAGVVSETEKANLWQIDPAKCGNRPQQQHIERSHYDISGVRRIYPG
jgi:hypothetical protein